MENNVLKLSVLFLFIFIYLNLSTSNVSAGTTEADCGKRNGSCSTCTDDSSCFWCGASKSCHKYNIIPKGCSKAQWYVRQCTIAGFWLIIVLPCVAVFLLICLVCCCWCCCCRTDKAKQEEKYRLKESKRKQEKDQRRAYHEDKNAEREVERDRIRAKYGLYNNSAGGGSGAGYQRFDEK